jgi:hypothetical protein
MYSPLLGSVQLEFGSIPGDLYIFNFSIAISTSEELGSGTNGSLIHHMNYYYYY